MRKDGIGLVLAVGGAGGGPLGATYEIGALNALAGALSCIDCNDPVTAPA